MIVLALCVVQIYGTDGLSTDGLALLDFKNGLISKNILEIELECFRCITMQLGGGSDQMGL